MIVNEDPRSGIQNELVREYATGAAVHVSRYRAGPWMLGLVLASLTSCAPRSPRSHGVPRVSSRQSDAGSLHAVPRDAESEKSEEPQDASRAEGPSELPVLPPPGTRDRAAAVQSCTPGTGWNGSACVSTTCGPYARFTAGKGCIEIYSDGMPILCPGCAPPVRGNETDAEFNWLATDRALANVVLLGCKADGGSPIVGHVSVTILPSGEVGSAIVDQPPFAGTGVGACIAAQFRAMRVPKFRGGPVKVGRSFRLE